MLDEVTVPQLWLMHGLGGVAKKAVGWAAAIELANRKRLALGLPPVPAPPSPPQPRRRAVRGRK